MSGEGGACTGPVCPKNENDSGSGSPLILLGGGRSMVDRSRRWMRKHEFDLMRRSCNVLPSSITEPGPCDEDNIGMLFLGSIGRGLKRILRRCETFLTVGKSAWQWPPRKKS